MSKPTATTVSRILGKKFDRAERMSTRIRGVHSYTTGFSVSTDARGDVWVSHVGRGNALQQVNAYDLHLMSLGFVTTRRTDYSLTVDGKEV